MPEALLADFALLRASVVLLSAQGATEGRLGP